MQVAQMDAFSEQLAMLTSSFLAILTNADSSEQKVSFYFVKEFDDLAFRSSMLLVGHHEEHPVCINW